jgi:hypothetical protein
MPTIILVRNRGVSRRTTWGGGSKVGNRVVARATNATSQHDNGNVNIPTKRNGTEYNRTIEQNSKHRDGGCTDGEGFVGFLIFFLWSLFEWIVTAQCRVIDW